MTTVSDPDKLAASIGSLWAAYLAVLATLRLEFARVVALALGIAEMVKFPIVRVAAPPLAAVLGPELKHWVPTIITTVINFLGESHDSPHTLAPPEQRPAACLPCCRSACALLLLTPRFLAPCHRRPAPPHFTRSRLRILRLPCGCAVIGFAWYLQKIVSAFNSALRGGRMFGAALFALLDERGVLAKLPCFPKDKPFDPNDSHLDEAVGYLVAGTPQPLPHPFEALVEAVVGVGPTSLDHSRSPQLTCSA